MPKAPRPFEYGPNPVTGVVVRCDGCVGSELQELGI
jgi:hypothetical protein